MNKKLIYSLFSLFIFFVFIYFGIGFYIANTILRIDPSCGQHEGSLPNTWSSLVDHNDYKILSRSEIRKNFPSTKYHINNWQEVFFSSREDGINISGWFFNLHSH